MQIVLNVLTGELDYVGSAGGGGGGVTSVFGGVGITNTPDPIIGVGTVDLDIFSLATGIGGFAAGDWLPFVDVSVGTTPASQRKLTVSDLATGLNPLLDHGLLLGLGDDDHAQYLRLAGRAGAANNALISTTAEGVITGSAADFGLTLRSTTDTSTRHGVTLLDNVTQVSSSGGIFDLTALDFTTTLTIDNGCGIIGYAFGNFNEHATIWTLTSGAVSATPIMFATPQPKVRNAAGETQSIGLLGSLFQVYLVEANGGALTLDDASFLTDSNAYSVLAGGTLAVTRSTGLDVVPDFATGVTAGTVRGVRIRPSVSGGAITTFVGVDIETVTAGTGMSLRSTGTATLRHTGNVRIGDQTAPAVALEVLGHVLLDNSGVASELRLREPSAGGASYTGFKAPALGGNLIYTLPTTQGAAASVLQNDGAGVLSWVNTTTDWLAQYTKLAGRTGTTNDTLLSTDANGTLTGSADGASALILKANTASPPSAGADIINTGDRLGIVYDSARIPTVLGTSYNILYAWPNISYTTDVGGTGAIRVVAFDPTIDLSSTWGNIIGMRLAYTLRTTNNATRSGGGQTGINFMPTFTPVGASGSLINLVVRSSFHNPTFTNAGTGNTATSCYGLTNGGTINTNWTATDWAGLRMNDPAGSGTITNLFGVDVAALTSHSSTIVAAYNSAVAAAATNYFLRDTGGAQSQFNGLITTYNAIALVDKGVPHEVATTHLTAQGAAIAATTIYAVPASGAGLYRVNFVATVTRAATTSSTLGGANTGFRVTYTDPDDSVVKTTPLSAAPAAGANQAYSQTNQGNTTASVISGSIVVRAKASTNIQYSIGYTSAGATTMQYNLTVTVEAL